MTDLVLAILHHLIVFGIASALAAELALMRPAAMSPQTVRLLGRFDAAYAVMLLSIFIVGFLRVALGAKGAAFYTHNPMFWAKIGAVVVMALIALRPTLRILEWQELAKADTAFVPAQAEVTSLRRTMLLEIHVFALIPIFAAMMARGVGYS